MSNSTADQTNETSKTTATFNITKNIQNNFETILSISSEEQKEKNEDVKSMILYYDGITQNIEDRRSRIAEFTWHSLGIIVTAFGIIAALPIISLFKIPILLVLGALFLVSLVRLLEFQVQSGFRYPFLELSEYSNRWKWFYYGNPHIRKINDNPFKDSSNKNDDQTHYMEGLDYYLEKYKEETISKELYDNLIQLYLLQVHNYYKNRFYLRLFRYDKWIYWAIVGCIFAYIIFVLFSFLYLPNLKDFLLTKSF